MKNELPLIRPTTPPARPKQNRIASRPVPCTEDLRQIVFKAQRTATTAATATTIQKIVMIKPMTKWIASAATATKTSPAAARLTIGVRDGGASRSVRMQQA